MSDDPFRLAIVGAGPWAERYIATVKQMPNVIMTSVISRALRQGVHSNATAFSGLTILEDVGRLEPKSVDGVIVAVPPFAMLPVCSALIDLKTAFLVEKPLSLSSETACRVRDVACVAGVPAMVDLIYLFNPGYRLMREVVRSTGGVDSMISVGGGPGPSRRGVPAVWDWAPHDLSMILDLTSADPIEIAVTSVSGDLRDHVVTVDLSFFSGARATMTIGNRMDQKHRSFECFGPFGEVLFQEQPKRLVRHSEVDLNVQPDPPLANVISTFIECARGVPDPMNTMDIACRINVVIEDILAKMSGKVQKIRPN